MICAAAVTVLRGVNRDIYAKLTHRAISAELQAAIENFRGIDTVDDIAQLTALLIPAVHSPLG